MPDPVVPISPSNPLPVVQSTGAFTQKLIDNITNSLILAVMAYIATQQGKPIPVVPVGPAAVVTPSAEETFRTETKADLKSLIEKVDALKPAAKVK